MLTQSKQTVQTIANGIALATAVVQQMAGNEVANTLNGVQVNKPVLDELIGSRIHAHFSNYTSKEVQS